MEFSKGFALFGKFKNEITEKLQGKKVMINKTDS